MYKIEQHRTDLAREFKANPFGPHSAELQKVLNVLRWQPASGKRVLVYLEKSKKWCIGRLPIGQNGAVILDYATSFDSREQGYWYLFKHRWKYHTGAFPLVPDDEMKAGS